MGFQVSPGVQVKEIDLTNVIPAVSTSIGGLAGIFTKGPIGEVITVGSEKELVSVFGEPSYKTYEYFFAAANFLKYGNTLRIINAEADSIKYRNAFVGDYDVKAMEFPEAHISEAANYESYKENFGSYYNASGFQATAGPYVKNKADFNKKDDEGFFEANGDIKWLAKTPGAATDGDLGVVVIPSSYNSTTFDGRTFATKKIEIDGISAVSNVPRNWYGQARANDSSWKTAWSNVYAATTGDSDSNNTKEIALQVVIGTETINITLTALQKSTLNDAAVATDGLVAFNTEIFEILKTSYAAAATSTWVGVEGMQLRSVETKLAIFTSTDSTVLSADFTIQPVTEDPAGTFSVADQHGTSKNFYTATFETVTHSSSFQLGLGTTVNTTTPIALNGSGGTNDQYVTFNSSNIWLQIADTIRNDSTYVGEYTLGKNVVGDTAEVEWTKVGAGAWDTAVVLAKNISKLGNVNTAGSEFFTTNAGIADFATKLGTFTDNTADYGLRNVSSWVSGNEVTTREAFSSLGTFNSVINTEFATANVEDAPAVIWDAVKLHFNEFPETSDFMAGKGGAFDECHIMIGIEFGDTFEVLETYEFLSMASDAVSLDGTNNYYRDVINLQSEYVYAVNAPTGFSEAGEESTQYDAGTGNFLPTKFTFGVSKSNALSNTVPVLLKGGKEGIVGVNDVKDAYDTFLDTENIEINLLIGGPTPGLTGTDAPNSTTTVEAMEDSISHAQQLISIAEQRRDCVAFISPPVSFTSNTSSIEAMYLLLTWVKKLSSSSYAVFDSSALYQYDRYKDVYRWNPACGAVAGLCAKTDDVADPWWSPAGFNRGQIFEVTRLGLNPTQTNRDDLYKNRLNPICAFPGEGTILYGDKTAQTKPSAFDRINVRRLFLVLEKAIATAAKYQLFEFNDEFTRAQFRNMVEPFLRDVKGRRGIYDFLVVCDETNNTGQVIDTNRFIADIYIKPARSINFMTLNFIATRTGVEFSEIVGKF
jgi:hypothetical protein